VTDSSSSRPTSEEATREFDTRRKVLVVDDEAGIRDSLRLLLKGEFEVITAEDGRSALEVLETFAPDLVLLDVLMPNLDGLQTLQQLREKSESLPVIMLTATNTVRTAVQAMKLGAVDYLNKPFDVEELTATIVKALDAKGLSGEVSSPQQERRVVEADFGDMVGRSPLMQELFKKVGQVAERDATVLITGESGTGKELVARRIHELSPRKNGPFVAINCAAIPESLIESELFGHEKGAFTHAIERRLGHFELANGGTLFLDEIGELSLPVQVKMLRFLQEHEFYRVGRSKPIHVNVRVITATNKNLEELVAAGTFRQDLYYRINVINLAIPPLRDRFEDITPLCQHFVKVLKPVYGERELTFALDAQQALIAYAWPGNVRELENIVESLMALSPKDEITEDDLPRKVLARELRQPPRQLLTDPTMSFEDAERLFESEMILKALKKTNYVQTRAAELLGISRRILKYKMDKLGITQRCASELAASEQGKDLN
jgi:DNA-binding NtrC family response regulator